MPKFLLTITGPSGSGKTSILHKLEKNYGVGRIITYTTRTPRPKEKDGVDYHFVSIEEFAGRYCDTVASTVFAGNHYAILKKNICEMFEDHDVIAVVVDPVGAEKLKLAFANTHSIYINIDPKTALARMAKRDGWKEAKKRQKADFEGGLYYDKLYEAAEIYNCILNNDRKNSVRNIAYDIMNYVEAQKWSMETLNNLAG